MKLLDGKEVKLKMLDDLKKDVDALDCKLGLTVIQVGEDPASTVYVGQKNKMASNMGFNFNHVKLSENVTEEEILTLINKLNNDDMIDGILVQMPIPHHLDATNIQNAISPYHDIDGLTDITLGHFPHKIPSLVPCTPMGIVDLLDDYQIDIEGKNVVIVGKCDLV